MLSIAALRGPWLIDSFLTVRQITATSARARPHLQQPPSLPVTFRTLTCSTSHQRSFSADALRSAPPSCSPSAHPAVQVHLSQGRPPYFQSRFTVPEPVSTVAALHAHPDALSRLTPPGVWIQVHHCDKFGPESINEFSLWFGGFLGPIRWRARHCDIEEGGTAFTDVQDRGPFELWVHRHTFLPLHSGAATQVCDAIWLQHRAGWQGLMTRVLFNSASLRVLFAYRRLATRYYAQRQ